MIVNLLTEHHLEFLSLKEAAEACLSLYLSKSHAAAHTMYYFVCVFQTQMLFIDAFIQNNRLDNVTQLMGYHPEYLDCFLKTQQYLLRGDGPLPYHFRHYIAIMVSIVSGAL